MSLPPEADPSGLVERAPSLASLLPDDALARTLAGGDTGAVYAALTARLAGEPPGPARDTLAALVEDRALFAMTEAPPPLYGVLGTGVGLVGAPRADAPEAPFIATRAWRFLGMTVWPLGQHLVRRGADGTLQVLGRVPSNGRPPAVRWAVLGALVVGGLGVPALVAHAVFTREVNVHNPLSRPVRVCVDGRCRVLQPEEVAREERFSLSDAYVVEAAWPEAEKPFETVRLPAEERAVYHVLGVGAVYARAFDSDSTGEAPRPLRVTDSLRGDDALDTRPGGWLQAFHAHADDGRWGQAATLAEAVALADAAALEARELAARAWLRASPRQAARFAEALVANHPEDVAAHRLSHDLLVAAGRKQDARQRAESLARADATSVEKALLRARLEDPENQRRAHEDVLARFPQSPEAKRAVARVRFAGGSLGRALTLLDEAREKSPESLEDLELRVRILLALKRVSEASNAVRLYAPSTKPRAWDFAVLASRLARVAGPTQTQYIARDFLPPEALATRERELLFELLSGEKWVEEKDVIALPPGPAHDEVVLTYAIYAGKARELVAKAPDPVLSTLEPEVAAVLALELSRQGDKANADRVFASSLPLLLSRETLEGYMRDGILTGRFLLLPPGLRVAAHYARAREQPAEAPSNNEQARAADALEGFARRALAPGAPTSIPRAIVNAPILCGTAERIVRDARLRRRITIIRVTDSKPPPDDVDLLARPEPARLER